MTASVSNFRLRVVTREERLDPKNPDLYLCMGDRQLRELTPVVLEVFDQWTGAWKRVDVVKA